MDKKTVGLYATHLSNYLSTMQILSPFNDNFHPRFMTLLPWVDIYVQALMHSQASLISV